METSTPSHHAVLALAAMWLPIAVAVPAFLLLPGVAAVSVVFAAWAVALAVLSRVTERAGVALPVASGVAALAAAGLMLVEVLR